MDPNSMPRPFAPTHSEQTPRELPELPLVQAVIDAMADCKDPLTPRWARVLSKAMKLDLAESEARAERLRDALSDLLSWFPEKSSPPEWRIRAGELGADDAVSAARAAIAQEAEREGSA